MGDSMLREIDRFSKGLKLSTRKTVLAEYPLDGLPIEYPGQIHYVLIPLLEAMDQGIGVAFLAARRSTEEAREFPSRKLEPAATTQATGVRAVLRRPASPVRR